MKPVSSGSCCRRAVRMPSVAKSTRVSGPNGARSGRASRPRAERPALLVGDAAGEAARRDAPRLQHDHRAVDGQRRRHARRLAGAGRRRDDRGARRGGRSRRMEGMDAVNRQRRESAHLSYHTGSGSRRLTDRGSRASMAEPSHAIGARRLKRRARQRFVESASREAPVRSDSRRQPKSGAGFSRAARRSGSGARHESPERALASTDTSSSSVATATNVGGSTVLTPQTKPSSVRDNASDAPKPIAMPTWR